MNKRTRLRFLWSILLSIISLATMGQEDSTKHVRRGWNFGILPSVAFDADQGFQYGALTNIYYYGDGSEYPNYLHSLYAEAAYTTKDCGIFRLSYDSKYLIPDHRLSIDLSYFPNKMCDFYGFNGYATNYKKEYEKKDRTDYITRAYYRYHRDLLRISGDIQGELNEPWNWNAGAGLLYFDVGSVDIDRMNRHAKDDDILPDTASLFDDYVSLGYLRSSEAKGGAHPYLHGGVTYDTREQLQNPERGIHADAFLTYYAGVGTMSDYNNLKFNAAWRHYLPIIAKKVTFAYRVGIQLNLLDKSPFYLNTYLNQLYLQRPVCEGLGGGNSVRGVMRNRVLAPGVAFANVEVRTRLVNFRMGRNMFYVGLNPFIDAGMVVQPYDDVVADPHDYLVNHSTALESQYRDDNRTHDLHLSGGCGLKVAMNENFVISADWATAFDKQDNGKFNNLYIKMGYMF